ncbi:hypothetical protein B0H19DRAFT_1076291 [Mycena capillaripes]|nr:hypothetical protein B0H19DRAFT_1076291 [Mycena capillaripes]
MEPPSPPHAFSPFLQFLDESDLFGIDIWKGTGLEGNAYFAARNDSVPLIRASQSNDIAAVRTLISSPGIRIDEGGLEKETALHMTCALGYSEIVETLISAGASVNLTDDHGSTPSGSLHSFLSLERVRQSHAHPSRSWSRSASYCWFSINAHNMDAVRILTPLIPLDFPGGASRRHITEAAVHSAIRHAKTEILEFLIQRGAS